MRPWTVKYEGRQCQIAVTGTKPVQTVIEDAARYFSLAERLIDAKRCSLMRRKTTRDDRVIEVKVDSMSTCQLANINTGEQLYLKVGKKSGEDTDPKTLVELTVFGMTGKISQFFSNSVSLLGIVADLVCEKKIDESVLLKDPEMVLVGKGITYKGDMLQTTTLKSLFLYGQRASFHLNHSSDFSLSYPRDEELESALEEE
jgi:hypothetical protein